MKHNKQILFFILSFLFAFNVQAQENISGSITDSKTNEKLAFVNIIYNSENQGTTTNIDGKFSVNKSQVEFLKISYIGYKDTLLNLQAIKSARPLEIKLEKAIHSIGEVRVFPTENPAHRIINLVIANKKINDPEEINSFSYLAYNKMIFTFELDAKNDTITIAHLEKDTNYTEARDFADKQHILITESVNRRVYENPDKSKETVIASRMSGFKNPMFTTLATQMQSFSFYKNFISISDKKYLNPIAKGGTKNYFFLIEDTIYNDKDTVFVISFRPRKGKNFEGLKGVLNINSNKYALQTVIAEPSEEKVISMKVQQKYQFIDNKQWFPTELNSTIIFNNLQFGTGDFKTKVLGIGKSYISEINLSPEIKKKQFSEVVVEMQDDSIKHTKEILQKYRVDSLTAKDIRTYHIIDSLGEATNLEAKMVIMESLITGKYPVSFIDFDINKFVNFNEFQGLIIGAGIETNKKISKYFSLNGYYTYSLRSKTHGYSGGFSITPLKNKYNKFYANYTNDLQEVGGYSFLDERNINSSEVHRKYLIEKMYNAEKYEIGFNAKIFKYLRLNLFAESITEDSFDKKYIFRDNFYYFCLLPYVDCIYPINEYYYLTNVGIKLRFAYKEKFVKTFGHDLSIGTEYPIVYLNYTRGMGFHFTGNKYEFKISESFRIKKVGKTTVSFVGGFIDGNLPYMNLYNGNGSYSNFSIDAENSFATMRVSEFIADKFASVYFRHNFGKLLFRTKNIKPDIVLVSNVGFGVFESKSNHLNVAYKTYEKGYFESGILLNNIFTQMDIIGYGFGVYYRYGPYQLTNLNDNFAYRFTLSLSI